MYAIYSPLDIHIDAHYINHQFKFWLVSTRSTRDYIYPLVMTNIAMERSTILKNGKPSISMGHLYHGELLVITVITRENHKSPLSHL